MKLKKILTAAAILAVLSGTAFAKTKVVTTIFPEYDWVKAVAGNTKDVEVTLLLGNGVDLHSYQPSIQDIAKISSADIFIYVGGESDGWVEDALKNARNKNMKVINLMETLGDKIKEEELVEGMQAGEDHDHDEHEEEEDHDHEAEGHHHHHHHHDSDEEEIEYDEHVWLSVRNAKIICGEIASALSEKNAKNADLYKTNLAAYSAKLDDLDSRFTEAVKNGNKKTLLFGDRFPFRYFTDDYGLKYYAAFIGCSAETEASFETVIFLAKKVDEFKLNAVCKIEKGDGKIARTIVQNSKNKSVKILTLDSMQSVTTKDVKAGASYLNIMEKNLEVLIDALK
ncbi:MAG: metal ABC transporter substrate-binding protein [Treponemataceae bacterium]|nr:metal ABC transporter substrate-binding protein [Treponemataceae bacterium]